MQLSRQDLFCICPRSLCQDSNAIQSWTTRRWITHRTRKAQRNPLAKDISCTETLPTKSLLRTGLTTSPVSATCLKAGVRQHSKQQQAGTKQSSYSNHPSGWQKAFDWKAAAVKANARPFAWQFETSKGDGPCNEHFCRRSAEALRPWIQLTSTVVQVLADAGVASRRASEELIIGGQVSVNGKVVKIPQTAVNPLQDLVCDRFALYSRCKLLLTSVRRTESTNPLCQQVKVNNKALPRTSAKRYTFALHKPKGYICANSTPQGTRSRLVVDLFKVCRLREACETCRSCALCRGAPAALVKWSYKILC